MPPTVIDVSTKTLLLAAVIVVLGGLAVVGGVLATVDSPQPEIREGTFVNDPGDGLFAVGAQSCSTDSDCEPTTCDGTDYMIDTDGDVACTDYDGDGDTECTGYDKTYSGAEYCGGRYDYNCDSTGCDGYKAACEDDCSANAGCDTYDFCGSDDDSTSSGSDTSSCSDQCESLTKKCSSGDVVQCQDTDSDACTDGFVAVASCDGDCANGACTTPDTGSETNETAAETTPETGTDADTDIDTTDSQTLDDRIAEVWTDVWTTVFGWL